MPRARKPFALAAPGIVPSMQASALADAIQAMVDQHNTYAAAARMSGFRVSDLLITRIDIEPIADRDMHARSHHDGTQ